MNPEESVWASCFILVLTIDLRNGTYYACGFNAYRSDDREQTWERIKVYNFKRGKRIESDPSDPEKIFITFGGTSGAVQKCPKGYHDVPSDSLMMLSVIPRNEGFQASG